MKIGSKITELRKEKGLSRSELGESIGTSSAIIGRYERDEMLPSIEIAHKIAKALDVSIDFLVGNSSVVLKGNNMIKRLEAINEMPNEEQSKIFSVVDALIRDFKAKQAYS